MAVFKIPSSADLDAATRRALDAIKSYVDTQLGVRLDTQGKGIVGLAEVSSSSWSNSTAIESDITGLSLTLSLSTSRRYKMVCDMRLNASVVNDVFYVRFVEGGVNRKLSLSDVTFITNAQTFHNEYVFVPASSASTVYKVTGARNLGTAGTMTLNVTTASPAQFWIEDLGPV